MTRIILIILTCLLSMNVRSQSFDIPSSPEKATVNKKGKKIKEKKTNEKDTKEKKGKKEKKDKKGGIERKGKTITEPSRQFPKQGTEPEPDLTAGKQVEGIQRSISLEELERLAGKGDTGAHTTLGMYYFQQDDERALPHLRAGAEAGNPQALYYLGGVYYLGKFGVEQDKPAAASCYLKAAQLGHVPAQYGIAVCLYDGDGVEKDQKAAREWMEKAARNNSEEARTFLDTHTFE